MEPNLATCEASSGERASAEARRIAVAGRARSIADAQSRKKQVAVRTLDPLEGAEALVRRASTTKATRPVALGAATALVSWTPAKEEVAAIIVACVCLNGALCTQMRRFQHQTVRSEV